jgi:hypothetical protein
MFDKNEIASHFKLPIEYLEDTHIQTLDTKMLYDLNMLTENNGNDIDKEKEKDSNTNKTCYDILFKIHTNEQKIIADKTAKYITTHRQFIRDLQSCIRSLGLGFPSNKDDNPDSSKKQNFTLDDWITFKNQTNFLQKYQYVEWGKLQMFNKNPMFLQMMSFYNLTSPVLQLTIPIIFLLLPFFIIKFVLKQNVSFLNYKHVLFTYFKNHSMSRFLQQISNATTTETKITASFTLAFFLFSIYSNTLLCIRFYKNMFEIHSLLFKIKCFLQEKLEYVKQIISIFKSTSLETFQPFHKELLERTTYLNAFLSRFENIHPNFSIKHIGNIGSSMSLFFDIYNDTSIHENICYIFGFSGYFSNLQGIYERNMERKVSKCEFRKTGSTKPTKLEEQYYVFLMDSSFSECNTIVKNNISLENNYIITGPNASGKTTFLKATLLNIIFSQQFGYGCYKNAKIQLYTNVFCYINIPDTSGRDSLFQSEAKQCLQFLQHIEAKQCEMDGKKSLVLRSKNTNVERKGFDFSGNETPTPTPTPTPSNSLSTKYLCVFDELFSGTNPDEATISAMAYLDYLSSKINVDFLITTHYHKICDLEKNTSSQKDSHNHNNHKHIKNIYLETFVVEESNTDTDTDIHLDKDSFPSTKMLYTYKLKKGVSNIKGGLKVLYDLQYPKKILENVIKYSSI